MNGSKSTRNVTVVNSQGLHLRPADLIVKCANRFQSTIHLVKGSERSDAKSIIALMTLAAVEGTTLSVEADGPDADQAVAALADLFAQKFFEE
jgi:phosphocarrier protein HPr